MRFLSLILAVAVAAVAIASIASESGGSTGEDQVRSLAQDFVYHALALSPSAATAQGYHVDRGVELDEQLDDYSDAALARARAFYLRSIADANRIPKSSLTPELEADLDVIRLASETQLLDLDKIQPFRHNPTVYVESIGNALYSPFILNYAPESKRLGQIAARIEKIPAFLDTAKRNLVDSPEIWNQVAQQENQGNIELVDRTIRAKIPATLKTRYEHATANALSALTSFNAFLKNDLSRRKSDWRLGSQLYEEKFKLTLATGDTPQQALADAEAKLRSIRDEMRRESIAVYPKFFPGKTPPGDLNTVVSQVLDKVAQQHATPAEYFEDARRDLASTTRFVKDRNLVTLPQGHPLQVIPTPEFMRGIYGVGGFSLAPVFEPRLGAYYWITPFTADMTPARIESKLREYNFCGLEILTIHEAMPGHYVQFEYADEIQPKWRGALRAVFSNGPYVEGWAVYATELMIAQGYRQTPEMRLTFGKQMLRVVANTILDIKLQTMGMTDRQALDLMINQTFQEREEAQKKLQRAKLSSCQLPTYFVGWRGWDRLRDACRNKRGSRFQLSEFNGRGLREGALPLPVLSKIILQ